ncbi:MAG TPA: glycosyltransferase family 39 protein [Flavobacteriaceae bacterium]|nr:glycosyltransferase family 39 protein [Flavobacteriaceae bacterium]
MPKLRLNYTSWIVLVVFSIFFVNLDMLHLNMMETRNMLTAREMVNLKHWVLTTMNNLPRYEKPPLPTWITAVFGYLFGFKSFVVMRLPAAFISLLATWTIFKFTPLLKVSRQQAFISTLIFATSFYIIFSGRTNQWDIYTHTFMLICIYFLWKFFTTDKALYKNVILAALFFGFSFMSKGPVSPYALFLPFLLSFGVVYGFKSFKSRVFPIILFLIIGMGTGGWWFIYARLADPAAFVETITVESSRWGSYNVRPFYYYWSFFVQSGVWTILAFVSLLFPYLKNRVSNRKAYFFTFLWTIFSVILLSVIPEKKSRYLLPVLFPLALNTSFYVEYLFRRFKDLPLKETAVVYFNHGLIALVCIVFPVGAYFVVQPEGSTWVWFIITSVGLLSAGIATIYFLRKKNYPKVFYSNILIVCIVMSFGFRLADSLHHNPMANPISNLKTQAKKENFNLYEYGSFEPRIIWDYGEPIPLITPENPTLPQEDYFGIIFQDKNMEEVEKLVQGYEIIREERFDNNIASPDQRAHRDRLIRNFFLLKEKNADSAD